MTEYLPICAIATVSDIVPLVDENRSIVKLGLSKQEFLPKGVKMLVDELKIKEITSQSISFKIAPKLNASGRMGNAYYSLDLYISDDLSKLKSSLKKVNELNAVRQKLSQEIYDDCLKIIKEEKLYKNKAIILKSSKWDSGLLGIACARLVDDFFRPVFLFSDVDGVLKGSVRSIDSINIHKVLSSCNSNLEAFGGHSMAAGLSLRLEHFDEFKKQIFEYLNNNTTSKTYLPIKTYDVSVKPEEINLQLAKELELLEPFGCDNPNPQFMITYTDCVVSKMPNFDSHLTINIAGTKYVSFNSAEYADDYVYSDIKKTIVELQINSFRGKETLTGVVKKSLFYDYGNMLQNIANGRILKQFYPKQKYDKYVDFFDINQAKELFDKLLLSDNGTAIIIYNKATYERFRKLLERYDLNHYIGGSQSKFEENCIVFALDEIECVGSYQNIVFLDTIQNLNFLNGYEGNVFALKNSRTFFGKLNLSHDYFGLIYSAIKNVISKSKCGGEISLYTQSKKISPNLSKLSYANFVASLYTFLELGIVKMSLKNGYHLTIDETSKKSLDSSQFYNSLKFISKINNQ